MRTQLLVSTTPYREWWETGYNSGLDKPHYPVPAIIYDILIEGDIIHCIEIVKTSEGMREGYVTYPWGFEL